LVLSPERAKLARLSELSDEHLACRAGHHSWPKLIPGRAIPRGVKSVRNPEDGSYLVTQTCDVCGKERWKVTLPKGVWDLDAGWRYDDPEGWIRFAIEEEISKRDLTAELYRRLSPQLFS
jgi:hypothetical protein